MLQAAPSPPNLEDLNEHGLADLNLLTCPTSEDEVPFLRFVRQGTYSFYPRRGARESRVTGLE